MELEPQITQWRAHVAAAPAVDGHDVDELEAHLRDQIADLEVAGLTTDEAFWVAVKRLGELSALSGEFAREHGGRLWSQHALAGTAEEDAPDRRWKDVVALAATAAVAVQVGRVATGFPGEQSTWLALNMSLLVLPFLAVYFAHRRGLGPSQWSWAAAPLVIAALVVNLYPFRDGTSTQLLAATHLPVALWFAVAYPYMGGVVRSHERRMDFVRFTGEWCIYYVLIALGGGVLTGLAAAVLAPAGVDGEQIFEWVLPSGAAGAVIVAAWLVESKKQVVENMAPVLTMLFTPLFAVMLTISAIVYVLTGPGGTFDRDLLVIFDALMVVVLGLVLYSMSARDPSRPPGWMDRIQLVAVAAALVLDAMVLGAMTARIGELGFTPNRVAALGLNLLLLVNLGGTAWRSAAFLRGRGSFLRLERWQTHYLPVFGVWAAVVVVVLPPVFSFD